MYPQQLLGTAIRWAASLPPGYRVPTRPDIQTFVGFNESDRVLEPSLPYSGHYTQRIRQYLESQDIEPRTHWDRFTGPWNPEGPVVLCPQSSMVIKNWPKSSFERLARLLEARGLAVEWQSQGTLNELETQLRTASVVVGVDTGPLHLADYMGVPVVGLYGVTSSKTFGPIGPKSRVIDWPAKLYNIPPEVVYAQIVQGHPLLTPGLT